MLQESFPLNSASIDVSDQVISRERDFYGNKRKTKGNSSSKISVLFLSLERDSWRQFLDVRFETSLGRVRASMGIRQIFLVCSMNVSGDFSEWPHRNGHRICPHISCCGDLPEVYIKSSWHGFQKRAVLVSQWFLVKRVGENWKVWRLLAKCWRKMEEFRIQFTGRKQNFKDNSTRIWYPQRCITET